MTDFTLAAYLSIVDAGLAAGYRCWPVLDWIDAKAGSGDTPALVLRHDVDRRPLNALAMAEAEAARGVRSTYYFRVVGEAYHKPTIRAVARLGHEVGYHYEDFFTAGYDPDKAIALFAKHLAELRDLASIKSIAMHGSPLAKHSNMKLWETHGFAGHGVVDCILSYDWSKFVFFTDTGRTFGKTGANLRDTIGGTTPDGVDSSADVARYLTNQRPPLVQLSTHPERWNDATVPWLRQAAIDLAANSAKRVIKTVAAARGAAR